MGGLLIADAARDIVVNTRQGDALWPNVVGIIGEYPIFDAKTTTRLVALVKNLTDLKLLTPQ
jgi:hypothetical protein